MLEIIPAPIHVALLTIPFLVTVFGAWGILFRPLATYLEERRAVVETAHREAEELSAAGEEQLAKLEEQLAAARERVRTIYADARGRAQVKEAAILATAREDAEEVVSEAVGKIRADKDAAAAALKSTATELSHDIASQVLGRSVA
jgi:F0F1-type ATP synthase membrane subunit b/b'